MIHTKAIMYGDDKNVALSLIIIDLTRDRVYCKDMKGSIPLEFG